jgi:hypothetical protein
LNKWDFTDDPEVFFGVLFCLTFAGEYYKMIIKPTDQCNYLKTMFIDEMKMLLKDCMDCEFTLRGIYYQYRIEIGKVYRLRYIREDRGRVFILGECLIQKEDYDFEMKELPVETVSGILEEIKNAW